MNQPPLNTTALQILKNVHEKDKALSLCWVVFITDFKGLGYITRSIGLRKRMLLTVALVWGI